MNVRLVVEQDRKRVRVIHLNPPVAVLGRGPGNAVRIPSAVVSRKHCQLRFDTDVVTVEDLDSVNGTYLNGNAVSGLQVVRPGDHLEVGPVTFVVEYEPKLVPLPNLPADDEDVLLLEIDDSASELDEANVPSAIEVHDLLMQPDGSTATPHLNPHWDRKPRP